MADELLDIFDEDGNFLGVKLKSEAHQHGLWHRHSHCWAFVKGTNSFILQRRSLKKSSYPGVFTLTATGHVDAGETPLAACAREFVEETGVSFPEIRFQLIEETKLKFETTEFKDYSFCSIFMTEIEPDIFLTSEPDEVAGFFTVASDQLTAMWKQKIPCCEISPYPHQSEIEKLNPMTIRIEDFGVPIDDLKHHISYLDKIAAIRG